MAKKRRKSLGRWNKTGVGAEIKMATEVIEGDVCVRLATSKTNAARVSLYFNHSTKEFFLIVTMITGSIWTEELESIEHAQIVFNRLSRRVHPDKLETIGITNPIDSDVIELENELAAVFDRAI